MDDPLPFRLCRGGRSGWSSLEPGTYSPGCPGNTVECGLRDGNSGDPGHYDQPLPVLLASRAGNRRAAPPSCKSTLHYAARGGTRSEEHTSELQSIMRISYAGSCMNKKKKLSE